MGTRIGLVLTALVLAACSGASPAPKGWTPVAGAKNSWSYGSGVALQEYSYSRQAYSGALPDLASQVTVDVLIRYRGAKLLGSRPFEPCPGLAGLARFALPGAKQLEAGFSVRIGAAIQTRYLRPAGAPQDSNVIAAMQDVLC